VRTRWKCRSCGSDFAEPEKYFSGSSIGHAPDELVCPYCKSDNIELADRCSVCGKVMLTSELTYGICGSCIEGFAVDHAEDYVRSDPGVWDAFAFYMHKRTSEEASA
jgi:predicted amidophosphoribosyltransferase